MNKVKAVVTIGPMSEEKETIKKLIKSGADVVRVNLSHASRTFCRDIVKKVRELNYELGTNVGIMFDLNGPVIRCGRFVGGVATYKKDDKIRIYMTDIIGDDTKLSVDYPELIDDVKEDDIIKLEDGKVELQVLSKGSDCLICKVLVGGSVTSNKNINIPGVRLKIPFLRVEDLKNIEFANDLNIDYLSLSYVKSSEDVLNVTDMLIEFGNDHMEVVSKIECQDAIDNLDDIIKMSNGVMVDRGDLSVEIPMERVPAIQKIVINKCHRMGKVSIIATDMLSSMEVLDKPTRAEVSDIANAVIDGTDAILLSGETTIGKHPIETLCTMEQIIKEAELGMDYDTLCDNAMRTEDEDITGMIATDVALTANKLGCKAIIIPTMSGYTARKISRFRPSCPIIAVSPSEETVKSLSLYFGVNAVVIDELNSLDKIINVAVKMTKQLLSVDEKDKIIITGGYPFKDTKTTNFMKIEEL